MKNIQTLEKEIKSLSEDQMREFRRWFEEYDAQLWDQQFEQDVNEGKLDRVAEQALSDYEKGKYEKL